VKHRKKCTEKPETEDQRPWAEDRRPRRPEKGSLNIAKLRQKKRIENHNKEKSEVIAKKHRRS
jgi:hypothetical protein